MANPRPRTRATGIVAPLRSARPLPVPPATMMIVTPGGQQGLPSPEGLCAGRGERASCAKTGRHVGRPRPSNTRCVIMRTPCTGAADSRLTIGGAGAGEVTVRGACVSVDMQRAASLRELRGRWCTCQRPVRHMLAKAAAWQPHPNQFRQRFTHAMSGREGSIATGIWCCCCSRSWRPAVCRRPLPKWGFRCMSLVARKSWRAPRWRRRSRGLRAR
jgi:hypothetical protein